MHGYQLQLSMHFLVILIVVSLLVFLKCTQGDDVTQAQPNILVFIADDLGWNDVGFHGSNQIPTPNIDALAYNGVILNRHYTMPTCTPSRTAFLTGKYPIRTGMQGYPIRAGEPRGLPLDAVTLPERLKQLGYVTRLIGKWHQGNFRTEYTPTSRGFDSFLGYWNGYVGYFNNTMAENGREGFNFRRDNCSTWDYVGRYATDVFTEEAESIITNHDAARPLYLQVAHLAPHAGNPQSPLEVPDVDEAHKKFSYISTPERRLYAEMVSKLDESVGRVVKALDDRGILNDTIMIFLADNGAMPIGEEPNYGSDWPLRGCKFTLHEGGIRNTATIWSSQIKKSGRLSSQLFHLSDWLPTLYTAAGGNVSDLGPIDGIDQWASLVNKNGEDPRTQILLNIDDVAQMEALIDSQWKITRGDYKGGVYDGYYGENGIGPENPRYNTTAIITSDVNQAFQKLSTRTKYQHGVTYELDEDTIKILRTASVVNCPRLDVKSAMEDNLTEVNSTLCSDYCLYDIHNDPCEVSNVADDNEELLHELIDILNKFRSETVPPSSKPLDPAGDPIHHNNTWVSWLDDSGSAPDQCSNNVYTLTLSKRQTIQIGLVATVMTVLTYIKSI